MEDQDKVLQEAIKIVKRQAFDMKRKLVRLGLARPTTSTVVDPACD
jgi:hypothetical protein